MIRSILKFAKHVCMFFTHENILSIRKRSEYLKPNTWHTVHLHVKTGKDVEICEVFMWAEKITPEELGMRTGEYFVVEDACKAAGEGV